MKFRSIFYRTTKSTDDFKTDDDGAVTVDWVVLTAAIVGLATAGGFAVRDGVNALGATVSTSVSTKTVNNGNTGG
ncbi:MAG: hypothetical protein AAGF56_11645 [Pseudomonadota bacterium]